mgnify:CR=1 FL=1
MTVIIWAVGVVAWLLLGWLAGRRMKSKVVEKWGSWDGGDEAFARIFLLAGPVFLVACSLVFPPATFQRAAKALLTRGPSWFGGKP